MKIAIIIFALLCFVSCVEREDVRPFVDLRPIGQNTSKSYMQVVIGPDGHDYLVFGMQAICHLEGCSKCDSLRSFR